MEVVACSPCPTTSPLVGILFGHSAIFLFYQVVFLFVVIIHLVEGCLRVYKPVSYRPVCACGEWMHMCLFIWQDSLSCAPQTLFHLLCETESPIGLKLAK